MELQQFILPSFEEGQHSNADNAWNGQAAKSKIRSVAGGMHALLRRDIKCSSVGKHATLINQGA